jgi:hypothetical protein
MNAAWIPIVGIVAVAMTSACGGAAAPPFKPVAETKVLMQAVLDPSADEIWDSAGEVLTADGVEDLTPKTEAEWTAVRNHAVTLTEAGNLLMMAPRAADGGQWMTLARALVDAGEQAWRAADAKDAERLLNAGDALYSTCVNCHEKYMPANR